MVYSLRCTKLCAPETSSILMHLNYKPPIVCICDGCRYSVLPLTTSSALAIACFGSISDMLLSPPQRQQSLFKRGVIQKQVIYRSLAYVALVPEIRITRLGLNACQLEY